MNCGSCATAADIKYLIKCITIYVSLFHIPLRIAYTSEETDKDSVGFHTITQMSHNFRYHTKLIYDSILITETIYIYRKYIDCTN